MSDHRIGAGTMTGRWAHAHGARARALGVLLACALLAGCGGLLESDGPPQTQWWLEPANPPTLDLPANQALVVDVTVVPGLDTDRILNLDDRAQLNSYAGAHWPDHLPEVLGSLLVRSLEVAHDGAVRQGDRAGRGECLLHLEARSFYGRVNSADVTDRVEVSLAGTLTCPAQPSRSLSASRSVPVRENRMAGIVEAFQAGFEGTLDDLAHQLGSS